MMRKLDLKASIQCGVQLKLKADTAVLDCKLKFLWVSELKFKLQEGVSADLADWELGKKPDFKFYWNAQSLLYDK